MKPDDIREAIALNTIGGTDDHPVINVAGFIGDFEQALITARHEGRKEAFEEAIKAVQDELDGLTSHDPGVCLDMVHRALQAKLDEVQK